jgi:hypothetical protein
MRPQATSVCDLELLVYEALNHEQAAHLCDQITLVWHPPPLTPPHPPTAAAAVGLLCQLLGALARVPVGIRALTEPQ